MNFFKWLISILHVWVMYIPKKIWTQISRYSRKVMQNRLNWREIKIFLKSRSGNVNELGFSNLELVVLLIFFLILSLVISEESLTRSVMCQSFIEFMSSLLPGIEMMSRDSYMPQIVLFELSVAYAMMPFMVFLFFYRARIIDEHFTEMSTSRFVGTYILGISVLLFIVYVSLQKETIFLFDPYKKSRIVGLIAQTKIGLGIVIWSGTWFVPELFGKTILASRIIVMTLLKRIQENER